MRRNRMILIIGFGICMAAITACQRQPASVSAAEIAAPHAGATASMAQTMIGKTSAANMDWPQFRGPDVDGFSPETGINKDWAAKPPTPLWKVSLSDKGFAGPSVADGLVYITDHDGSDDVLRAINLQTGADAWKYRYPDTNQFNYGYARATPVIDEGHVYELSRLGLLNCLDAKTGTLIWSKDIIKEFHGHRPGWDLATSPLIDGDRVVVCPGGPNAAMVVLNKLTGATIWEGGGSDVPGYDTPEIATIQGIRQYVFLTTANVIGVDCNNGKLLWSYPWKTGADVNAATPLVIGNSVFVTSGYGHGCVMLDITPTGPVVRYTNKEIQAHFHTPIFYKGYIYGKNDYSGPGYLVCMDPKDGSVVWKQPGFEKGGMVAVDGVILIMNGANGDLVMVDLSPNGYKELGRIKPLGGQSWTDPIIAEDKIIVRNTTTLTALDLK